MLSLSRARMSEPGTTVLIVAASGRALAAAARRAGYRPLALDFFGDIDTREVCAANRWVAGGLEKGFAEENLVPVLKALAKDEDICGVVYGAGFEDRPGLLDCLARHWTLLGNPPDVVRRVKDPVGLAELCAGLNIAHPEISARRPAEHHQWLVKSVGGSGGMHVAPAAAALAEDEGIYFQRKTKGESISIQFLADGHETEVIGLSRQWVAPAPGEPFRFGGVLRPANLSPQMDRRLRQAAAAVTAACGLRGLNTIDVLVKDNAYTLIEINPRPGAALDIFEDPKGRLFRAHVNACTGCLPAYPLEFTGAAAATIVYTPYAIASLPDFNWPEWTADRQKAKSALRAHDPFCTIKATADEPFSAQALIETRINLLLDRLAHIQNRTTAMGRKPPFE
jgi:predicted ATP-grasp superfamily ATP-dependent carboligase